MQPQLGDDASSLLPATTCATLLSAASSPLNVIVPRGEQRYARETGFPFSLLILPSLHLKFHNQCAL